LLCQDAYDVRTGKLKVTFEKIGIDNPKVDGIILYKGSQINAGFNEVKESRIKWDRKIREE